VREGRGSVREFRETTRLLYFFFWSSHRAGQGTPLDHLALDYICVFSQLLSIIIASSRLSDRVEDPIASVYKPQRGVKEVTKSVLFPMTIGFFSALFHELLNLSRKRAGKVLGIRSHLATAGKDGIC
jgi:hypothetical protein